MGLTKQYLRYAPAGTFNVVGSTRSNVVYLNQGGVKGKLCAVGACEHVIIWDLRKGEKVSKSGIRVPTETGKPGKWKWSWKCH